METKWIDLRIQQVVFGTVRNIVNGFILERKSRGLSKRTVAYYVEKLDYFCRYLDEIGVINVEEITPEILRQYLLYLSNTHNPGGCHRQCLRLRNFPLRAHWPGSASSSGKSQRQLLHTRLRQYRWNYHGRCGE